MFAKKNSTHAVKYKQYIKTITEDVLAKSQGCLCKLLSYSSFLAAAVISYSFTCFVKGNLLPLNEAINLIHCLLSMTVALLHGAVMGEMIVSLVT